MKNDIYTNLINNISKSIKLSLNEMAKKIDHRTIDRKLWLSVASVCSRNKTTEAEFVKPMRKLTVDDLLNRYVASLLVMKKPCPKNERDIEKLKTFKLFALRALELGATISDIQNLYNINAGITTGINVNHESDIAPKKPILKPMSTPAPKPTTPRVRKPLSERVLKLKDVTEIKNFLMKHMTGCTTSMDKMDKFLTDADAVIQAYKMLYSNGFYSGFSLDPFGWNDDESLTFIPSGESYELYGDSYYGERYQHATKPEIVYHYSKYGSGNNVLLRTLDKKKIKQLLAKITTSKLNSFITNIAESAIQTRLKMIRAGEIKVRGVKFDLSLYGFDKTPSSYKRWAQQYLKNYLKNYHFGLNIEYTTNTGEVIGVTYEKGRYFLNLYIQNDSTDRDTSDYLDNFLNELNSREYEYRERGDYRNGDFICRLYSNDMEEICKILYNNAKEFYVKNKGK